MKEKLNSLYFLIGISFFVAFLDQITKNIIKNKIALNQSLDIIGQYLRITFIYNEHAVFGLRFGNHLFFVIFMTISIVLIIYCYFTFPARDKLNRLSLAIILGGAWGNFLDRVIYKKVVDFIDMGINNHLRWPVYNVADTAVTVGAGIMIFHMVKTWKNEKVKKKDVS